MQLVYGFLFVHLMGFYGWIVSLHLWLTVCMVQGINTTFPEQKFDTGSGACFVREGQFVYTGVPWCMISDFDVRFLGTILKKVSGEVDSLQERVDSFETDCRGVNTGNREGFCRFYEIELAYLRDELLDLTTELNNLRLLLGSGVSSSQNKRGLFDFGGTVLKFLFGTSTEKDVADLNGRIDQVAFCSFLRGIYQGVNWSCRGRIFRNFGERLDFRKEARRA